MAASLEHKARLLDLYHRKSALSSLPNGYDAYFQLGKIRWGFGLIDTSTGSPLIKDIPGDLSALEETITTGTATYSLVAGKIVIVATLPRSAIPDGQSRRWNMIGIEDKADGELIGAMAVNEQTVTNKMDVTVTLEITTGPNGAPSSLSMV